MFEIPFLLTRRLIRYLVVMICAGIALAFFRGSDMPIEDSRQTSIKKSVKLSMLQLEKTSAKTELKCNED